MFHIDLFKLLSKKEIRCRECGELVDFNEDLYNEIKKPNNTITKPTCDGINVICPMCDYEDDISQLYGVFKDGSIINMEDFYSDYTSMYEENVTDKQLVKEFNVLKNR